MQLVPSDYRQTLQDIVQEYRDVFPETLPPKRDIEHEIQIESSNKPLNRPPYRLGLAKQDELEV